MMRSSKLSIVSMLAVLALSSAARANVIALTALQAVSPDSTFTLSSGGQGLPSSFISNTVYKLQVDDGTGRTTGAQFLNYYQTVAPLTLPDGQGGYVNTGNLTVEMEPGTSGIGSYDPQTGAFTTSETYKITYTGDLTAIGLQNGGFVEFPSTSSGVITYDLQNPGTGTIEQHWSGTYSPLALDYTCAVYTAFPEPASLGLLGLALVALRRRR
jgi:MYXO-CTERM domain-containing protein